MWDDRLQFHPQFSLIKVRLWRDTWLAGYKSWTCEYHGLIPFFLRGSLLQASKARYCFLWEVLLDYFQERLGYLFCILDQFVWQYMATHFISLNWTESANSIVAGRVTLGKLLNFSVPYKMKMIVRPCSLGCCENEWIEMCLDQVNTKS